MNKFNHPLMDNNITQSDINALIFFLKKNKKKIFTQSTQVSNFEKKWSDWLGVKYSIFVNSGSSANLLTLQIIKILHGTGEIIVPPLTWISDVASVIQNNFKPVFVDINLKNLCMDEDQIIRKINKKTRAVFITHAQGFNGLSNKLLQVIKDRKIILLEDVCESHGAMYEKKKLGTFGLISNFSFYYAHHLSTIEGGMICTNDKKIFEIAKMLRSHGMLRECGNKTFEKKMQKKYKYLSPKFIFLYPAYNVRNTELAAVIGLNQLKELDRNNKIRSENLKFFLKHINNKYYFTDFLLEGNSNYAFPLILKEKNFNNRDLLERIMKKNKIEFRRGNAGGGNQLRQPYLKNFIKKINFKNFTQVDHVHFFGYYIGNYPTLNHQKIIQICKILNGIKYE